MSTILDFLNTPKTHPQHNGTLSDILSAAGNTGQSWANVPNQLLQYLQGKPITPNPEPNAAAKRGLDTLSAMLMGSPVSPESAAVANTGEAAANQGVAEANQILDTAKTQPGGLQAGFIKTGGNATKASSPVRITLKPSVYGAGREGAVQKTVDNIVPGATATEKYNNLAPTMDDLGNKITQVMTQNPKSASLDQVMSDYDKNLQDQGVYRTSSATKSQIQQTAQKYITDLNNEASGNNANLNPTSIADTSLQKIKQNVNQDAQSIYKKIENGTTLTDKDRVVLAARQTLDDTLSSLHPDIKDPATGQVIQPGIKNLTTQQSHLYDAADSLYKAREAEIKAKADEPGTLKKVINNPLFKYGLAGLAGGGATLAPDIISKLAALGGVGASDFTDYINNHSNNQGSPQKASPGQSNQKNHDIHHGIFGDLGNYLSPNKASKEPENNSQNSFHDQSVSNSTNNVNRYALQNDPIKTGQLMQTSDYANQRAALQQKMGTEEKTDPIQWSADNGELNALDTKWDSQTQLRNVWIDPDRGVGNVLAAGDRAYQAINNADPNFFNAWNKDYYNLQNSSNGKYAQMGNYLKYISNATGVDFTQYKTKDALLSALDASMNTTKDRWDTLQQQYNSPTQTLMRHITPQPAQPQQPIQWPKGGFGSTGNLNTGSDLLNGLLNQAKQ